MRPVSVLGPRESPSRCPCRVPGKHGSPSPPVCPPSCPPYVRHLPTGSAYVVGSGRQGGYGGKRGLPLFRHQTIAGLAALVESITLVPEAVVAVTLALAAEIFASPAPAWPRALLR